MTRTERRALERKGIKEANRIAKRAGIDCVLKSTIHASEPESELEDDRLSESAESSPEFVSAPLPRPATPAQHTANQQNAQHSTGPRTIEGKAKSSCNSSTHGLCGTRFRLLHFESQEEYDELEAGLMAEHGATTLTETLLVRKMAQSWWLRERAQFFIDTLLPDETGKAFLEDVPLYSRYQAQHDRAFHKALNDLLKIRAERRREEAARDKGEKAELLFAQKAEYNSLRAQVLRMKLNSQTSPKKPPTEPALEFGFVSQCASEQPTQPSIATEIHLQDAAA